MLFRLSVFLLLPYLANAVQPRSTLVYHVREGQPPLTQVGNITRDGRLDQIYTPQELHIINYRLTNQRSDLSRQFTIDRLTGILRTNSILDRESPDCPDEPTCVITLTVLTIPGEFSNLFRITVNIMDINDNFPTFEQKVYNMTIAENTAVGTQFALPVAEDADSFVFGVKTYDLIPSSQYFKLKISNVSGGYIEVRLELVRSLDRETEAEHAFRLIARDANSQNGVMAINIDVSDYNDNMPSFEKREYTATIAEDIEPDASILSVHALDADDTAVISYQLSNQVPPDILSFGVDRVSGVIYTLEPLDRERVSSYTLTIQATDGDENPSSAYCRVVLTLRDTNDNAPQVRINSIVRSTDGTVHVEEEGPSESVVAIISASDSDLGNGGLVMCSISSNPYFQLEEDEEPAKYILKTQVSMDREEREEYEVELQCSDRGEPRKRTSETIIIRVVDINDHVPEFWFDQYDVTLMEGNAVGTFIVQVNASDPDSDRNGAITFKFDNPRHNELLDLNPITGVIRANVEFDYEVSSLMRFVIIAYDQGMNSESSTATLILSIEDINDEPPTFVEQAYVFQVYEEQAAHATVGIVQALDADSPPYNVINYFIEYNGDDLNNFAMNERTGEIYTTRQLDREQQDQYHLKVRAINQGYVMMQSFVNVTIFVEDRNDNFPFMLFPTLENNTIYIRSDALAGEVITRVRATDMDNGKAGELSYYCDGNETFVIDETSGEVSVQKNLSSIQTTYFNLKINISDHGSPPRHVIAHLYIQIEMIGTLTENQESGFVSFIRSNLLFLLIGLVLMILFLTLCTVIVAVCMRQRKHNKKQKNYNGDAIVLANKKPMQNYNEKPIQEDDDTLKQKKMLEALANGGIVLNLDTGESSTDMDSFTTLTVKEKVRFNKYIVSL